MSSLNQVNLIGNLGKDPETRTFDSGDKVANFSVACTERWKKDGEQKEKTEWVNVAVFGSLAEICAKYLKKGSKVYLSGSLQTRKYQKDGEDRYATEVVLRGPRATMVMLDTKPREESSGGGSTDDYSSGFSTGKPSAPRESYDLNDEIPF